MSDLQQSNGERVTELEESNFVAPSLIKRIEIWSGRLAMCGITATMVAISLKG
ncbi:MAG: hypothetical protein HC881_12500 [Leptolyngbyaceae cyanobacterium SL_7_1]|nr:hypothetical protein [Leptolyngbyaceae cyanobacterium SL_7_1]